MADWILESKLDPPLQRSGTVARDSLLDRLDKAAESLPLTLLLAPPGYGKTTLLAQWLQHLHERGEMNAAWLSLDEDDHDPGHLAAYLGAALSRAGITPAPPLRVLMQHWQHCDVQTAADALLQTLRGSTRRVVLILDDYDRACSEATDSLLTRLVEHAGTRLHLLLATRATPELPLARLAIHGQLERMGAHDLALTEAETAALLGANANAQLTHTLHERTEGWAVALRLAALWANEDSERQSEFIRRFSGRTSQLAAYLAEQIVDRLEPPLREFLLHTCVLERFNTALANHVRQSNDSSQLLAQLQHFHGLLVPLDGEQEWFRYHSLFADYLRQQLERTQQGESVILHRRAAHWFAEHGFLHEAVRHALQAGDEDTAAGFIAAAGTWQLLLQHGIAETRALLEPFPLSSIGRSPALNLTQAFLHLRLGEFSHAQTLLAQFRDLPEARRAPFERDYTVVVAWLRMLLDEICANPRGAAQLAGQASALDEDDYLGRGMLLCIAASAALGRGDLAHAAQLAGDGERTLRHTDNTRAASYALLHLGQVHFLHGQLDQAETVWRQALLQAEAHVSDDALPAACRCFLARLECERGNYAEAATLLDGALEQSERLDGWFDSLVAGYEAALALARLDDNSGRAIFSQLERIDELARRRKLGRLTELASAWRLYLMLDHTDPALISTLVANTGAEVALTNALRHPQHWRHGTALCFAISRWHFLSGHGSTALPLLRTQEQECLARGDQSNLARTRALVALVMQQRGEIDAALPVLREVLDYVARNRAWQIVLEMGMPAKSMLRLARQHDPEFGSGTERGATVQTLLEKLQKDEGGTTAEAFSAREREVLAQLARGHSNKQIARNLHLSENTVKFHLKNLYRKLNAGNRDAAVAAAAQLKVH